MALSATWPVRMAVVAACGGLFFAVGSSAQAGGIFGHLNGPGSVGALPGVEMRLCSTSGSGECFTAITASDGSFYFDGIPEGQYNLETASSSGQTLSEEIFVPSDGELNLTVIAQ